MDASRLWSLVLDDGEPIDPGLWSPLPPVADMASSVLLLLLLQHQEAAAAAVEEVGSSSSSSRIWRIPRGSRQWEDLQGLMDEPTRDAYWRAHYRMSYSVFQNLVEEIRPFINVGNCDYVRAPLELDKAVAMVVDRLAHGHSAVVVADMYSTGPSTVGKYTRLVTEVLSNKDKLYAKYVRLPEGVGLARVVNQFKAVTELPNVCGAIGGTHVKLSTKPPRQYGPKDYWSRHCIFSVLLQCVCDCDLVFWDVCCNAPGGESKSSHFLSSPLCKKLASREVMSWPRVKVKGVEVHPYLVADGSYASAPFLLQPFSGKKAVKSTDQVEFDKLVKKGQDKVEQALSLLKSRWKILRNLNVSLTNAAQVAVACCVLHNICQMSGEPLPEELEMDEYVMSDGDLCRRAGAETDELREAVFKDWLERSGCSQMPLSLH